MMWVFCARLEGKLLMKLKLPRKLCSSCLFAGRDIFRIACTFWAMVLCLWWKHPDQNILSPAFDATFVGIELNPCCLGKAHCLQ